MNLFHLSYKAIGAACAAVVIPSVWLHYKLKGGNFDYFHQRLGLYPHSVKEWFNGEPRLWMHAVSVGEVGAAVAILEQLNSDLTPNQVALSVTTEHGLSRARALADPWAGYFYAPIDLAWSNQRTLSMIRPKVVVLLETEIWPNLIMAAHGMGIPVVLSNGRISVRTIKYYRKIKPLMRYVLSHVDRFSMISVEDAERIASLGAPAHRITVNGNAKFDALALDHDQDTERWISRLFHLNPETPVFVAGSTRFPEEQMLLDAYERICRFFPQTLLIIAPRHIQRADQVEQWVIERGLQCQRRSRLQTPAHPRTAPVVILDTIGELAATYAVADFVFCGGSLVPKGGQNLLEPAVWAKPVLCGPSMEDFAEAYLCIKNAGGCAVVRSSEELAAVALDWLRNPRKARAIGLAGRRVVDRHRGAAARHAAVIDELLAR